ncbi:MAG: phosphocholine cytidylyltransferase family protein [Coriobacteriales bacterium]|nr:phosphocholine cytidylyltransferase family protein [Coriobacteriales bacterium]
MSHMDFASYRVLLKALGDSASLKAADALASASPDLRCADDEGVVTQELIERGWLDGNVSITPNGLEALEPYRARRAVLLASGFGNRMLPITARIPKPLVPVHGTRIIDTLLDALVAIDVTEICIVRGYLAEQFDQLLQKYPGIRFINNPIFDSTNNISSATLAARGMRNAYVFESDLLLRQPDLLCRYQYCSNYLGVKVDATQDWCFTCKDGRIMNLAKGGSDCYHMFGISYWSLEDGERLESHLPEAFQDDDWKQRFWDDVPCVRFNDSYDLRIRPCSFDDIQEIDTFAELQQADPLYLGEGGNA